MTKVGDEKKVYSSIIHYVDVKQTTLLYIGALTFDHRVWLKKPPASTLPSPMAVSEKNRLA